MSNHFTYEMDERNLKQKLKNFELEYNSSILDICTTLIIC